MIKLLKMYKVIFYLCLSLIIAGFSLDIIVDWIWSETVGIDRSSWQIIFAFLGLFIGMFTILKIVYRIDKRQGKVKRYLRIFE